MNFYQYSFLIALIIFVITIAHITISVIFSLYERKMTEKYMNDYYKDLKDAADTLDKYDLTLTLQNCHEHNLDEIKKALQNICPEIKNAIDVLTESELIMYLEIRYKIDFSKN